MSHCTLVNGEYRKEGGCLYKGIDQIFGLSHDELISKKALSIRNALATPAAWQKWP